MYKNAMKMCGLVSLMLFVGYLVAEAIATSDGPHGFEVADKLARILLAVSLAGAVASNVVFIADRSNRESALANVRPIIHEEVAAIANDVGRTMSDQVEQRLSRMMAKASGLTVAAVKESITGELFRDELQSALSLARTYGMAHEARMRTANNGSPVSHLSRRREDI